MLVINVSNCAQSCEPGSQCRSNECIFGSGKLRGVGILEWGLYEPEAVLRDMPWVQKFGFFVRNPDELANERAELAQLLNKAGTCFLHEMSLCTASGEGNGKLVYEQPGYRVDGSCHSKEGSK